MANYKYDFTGLMDKPKSLKETIGPKTTRGVYLKGVKERTEEAEKRISKRGSLWENITRDLKSESMAKKAMGVASLIGSPISTFEHMVSNPMLAMQGGEFGIGTLLEEAGLGFTGKRRGEFGDIFKIGAGMSQSEPISDLMGLGLVIMVLIISKYRLEKLFL